MNALMPKTPHPPFRYYNLEDHVEGEHTQYSASPTPPTGNDMFSSSPTLYSNANTTPELMNKTDQAISANNHFASLAEARQWQIFQQKAKSKNDNTLPAEKDKPAYVAQMVKAFSFLGEEAMKNADGSERCSIGVKEQIERAIGHQQAVEAMCWQLLHLTIQRCEGGSVSAIYAAKNPKKKEVSFENRIKGVIKGLKVSKNLCKHLFEAPFSSRVVDDPWTEIRKVERNVGNNKRKQELMRRGKQMEDGDDGEDGEEPEENDSCDTDGEPRSKRRRSGTKKA